MLSGEAHIAPYYAGDCLQMTNENEDLAFFLPDNQGFNFFIDSMCIPKCAQQKDEAELFINFLCDPEISGANMDYICYSSPIVGAKEFMDEYLANSPITYPDLPDEVLKKGMYTYLPQDVTQLVEKLFMDVRNG